MCGTIINTMASLSRWISTLVVQLMLGSVILSCFLRASGASDFKIRIDEILDEEISEELEQYDLNQDGILDKTEIEIGYKEIEAALTRYQKQNAEDLGEVPLEDEAEESHPWKAVVAVTVVLGLLVVALVHRCQRVSAKQSQARNAALRSQRDKWLDSFSASNNALPVNGSTSSHKREVTRKTMGGGGEKRPDDEEPVPLKKSKMEKERSNPNLDSCSSNSSSNEVPMETSSISGSVDSVEVTSSLKDVKLDSTPASLSQKGEKLCDGSNAGLREVPKETMEGGEKRPDDQDPVPLKKSKTGKERSDPILDTSSNSSANEVPMETCLISGSVDSVEVTSSLKDVKFDSTPASLPQKGEKLCDGSNAGLREKATKLPQKKAVSPKSNTSPKTSRPATKSTDNSKLGKFLSEVFSCEVVVTAGTKTVQHKNRQVLIPPSDLLSSLGNLVQRLCEKSIGPKQVKSLVKLLMEAKALGPKYQDDLVDTAFQQIASLAFPRLARLVLEAGNPGEEDEDDDLWSDFKDPAASTNERADALLRCLSGCFVKDDCPDMSVELVVDLYHALDAVTAAALLQQLFMETSRKFMKLKRFDDIFSQPELLALEKILSIPSCAPAFAALLQSEVEASKKEMGQYFQTTGLGSLLSISPMPRVGETVHSVETMPQVAAVFESITGWPQSSMAAILEKENAIQRGLERIQQLVQSGLSHVLRYKQDASLKEWTLAWMAAILNLNQERMALSLASYMDHKITCGDGYMVNFCAVLLYFFEPIFKPDTRCLVDLTYCSSKACRLHYNLEMCLAGNQIVSQGIQEVGPLPENLQGQHKFVTECYHLCQRAITVCILPTLHLVDTVYRDISREISRTDDSSVKKKLQARINLLLYSFQAHVWEDKLVHRACLFYLAQSSLLLSRLQSHQEKGGDAGDQQLKATFGHIPEFAIKDMAEWFSRLTQVLSSLDRSILSRLSFVPFVDLSVGLLEHRDLLLGPISASRIVRALLAFIKGDSHSPVQHWGQGVSSDLKCAVLACPSVQKQLCPALLHTYVSVDAVEGLDVDKESFDKYQSRLEIGELIQVLWERADCRESVLSLCGQGSFQQFLGAIMDSLQHLLPDSLTRLSNVRKLEKEKENKAEWGGLSGRDQAKKEQFLVNEESTAKGFLSMAKLTLKFLLLVTGETRVAACFATPPLSIRAASIMCDLIDSLCGLKSKNYNVKNKEKYGFKPSELVQWLMEVMIRILDQDSPGEHNFSECLTRDPAFELEHLKRAQDILKEKGLIGEDALGQLGTYIFMLQGLHEDHQMEKVQAGAPEGWLSGYLGLAINSQALRQAYESRLQDARFFTANIKSSHSYQANFQEMDSRSTKAKTLMKEMRQLQQNLPVSPSAAIFVVQDRSRMDVMRCLISGPEDTPYSLGLFAFDVYFPSSYPSSPPLVKIITTGHGTVRFNPNLYADGKVCLSLLGTWHAANASEKWTPGTSSLYQILVSIQSMILTSHPVFNEPGHERLRETNGWEHHSREYNWKLHLHTVRHAMLGQLRNPPPGLERVVRLHFALQKDAVLKQCAEWLADCQDPAVTRGLQRDSDALRHELLALDPAAISLEDEEESEEEEDGDEEL